MQIMGLDLALGAPVAPPAAYHPERGPVGAAVSVILLGVLTMGASAQPPITVSQPEFDGVALLPSSHPDFQAALRAQRARQYDVLLPYSVAVRNDTDQEIIAYSVIWRCADASGQARNAERSVNSFATLGQGTGLMPHATHVVSLSPAVEAGSAAWDPAAEAGINRLVASLSGRAAIRISLDAVVFADGGFVGPDTARWVPRWKAWLEAEKEVFNAVVQAGGADAPALLRRLAEPGQAVAMTYSRERVDRPEQLGVIADRWARGYADCLALAKGYFALSILNELNQGALPTLENLRHILGSKRYPAIHSRR
jgi:hypothetical protein